jgi:hypothetical protein
MLRFRVNRSWGFILTLCLLTTCFFVLAARSPAVANAGPSANIEAPDQPIPVPPPGDPDVPTGPGDGKLAKHSLVRGGSYQVVSQREVRLVGDGTTPASVVMDRVELFLLGLRSLYLHF